jgi:hypothetical protein
MYGQLGAKSIHSLSLGLWTSAAAMPCCVCRCALRQPDRREPEGVGDGVMLEARLVARRLGATSPGQVRWLLAPSRAQTGRRRQC